VILVRSGHTSWAANGRFVGTKDLDLDRPGIEAAYNTAEQLKLAAPTALLASDLRRAVSTVAALERSTGLSARADVRLRPPTVTACEGLTEEQISARYPAEAAKWLTSRRGARFPGGGESRLEAGTRAADCIIEALAHGSRDEVLVVVTHDVTARAVICKMLNLPDPWWGTFEEISHCAWSTISETKTGWRLIEHNLRQVHTDSRPDVEDEAQTRI
jgi:glucosyl-3-phosphoglycerate phosphatase